MPKTLKLRMENQEKTSMQLATKKYRRQRDDIDNDDGSEVEKKTRTETPKGSKRKFIKYQFDTVIKPAVLERI